MEAFVITCVTTSAILIYGIIALAVLIVGIIIFCAFAVKWFEEN